MASTSLSWLYLVLPKYLSFLNLLWLLLKQLLLSSIGLINLHNLNETLNFTMLTLSLAWHLNFTDFIDSTIKVFKIDLRWTTIFWLFRTFCLPIFFFQQHGGCRFYASAGSLKGLSLRLWPHHIPRVLLPPTAMAEQTKRPEN